MKKLFTIFTTTLLLTALIVSCGKETQSSTQGGGLFKVRVTITPPLQVGLTSFGFQNYFRVTMTSVIAAPIDFLWYGSNQSKALNSWESEEYSVTKGQNANLNITLNNGLDNLCRQVMIEASTNNSVFKTVNLEMGGGCKNSATTQVNFIIP